MPAPLRVDWDIAKEMYLGGLTITDVAFKTGIPRTALEQRAHRYKWKEAAKQVSDKLSERVSHAVRSVSLDDAQTLVLAQNEWKHRVIRVAKRHMEAVEAKDPETLKLQDFETLARIADTTDKIARRSFGLDVAQNQTAHLMVHVQSDLASGSSGSVKQLAPPSDVIDVESVPTK